MKKHYKLYEKLPVEEVLERSKDVIVLHVRGNDVSFKTGLPSLNLEKGDYLVQVASDDDSIYTVQLMDITPTSKTTTGLKPHVLKFYDELSYDEAKNVVGQVFTDFRE